MLRKIADRTVHRKVYRSALFISSTNYEFVELLLSTFNAIVSSTSRVISTIYFMFNSIYNNFIICSKFI